MQYSFMTNVFKENIFGGDHEFKFGAEYSERKQRIQSAYSGNMTLFQNFQSTMPSLTRTATHSGPGGRFRHILFLLPARLCPQPAGQGLERLPERFGHLRPGQHHLRRALRLAAAVQRLGHPDAMNGNSAWDALADPDVQTRPGRGPAEPRHHRLLYLYL